MKFKVKSGRRLSKATEVSPTHRYIYMYVYSVYTKPAECQKLNQQNLIISRVAVDVSVSVSFNSDLYLCAFYALYSELLQSLKNIKLPPSLPLSLSLSFLLIQQQRDRGRAMRTRQC